MQNSSRIVIIFPPQGLVLIVRKDYFPLLRAKNEYILRRKMSLRIIMMSWDYLGTKLMAFVRSSEGHFVGGEVAIAASQC